MNKYRKLRKGDKVDGAMGESRLNSVTTGKPMEPLPTTVRKPSDFKRVFRPSPDIERSDRMDTMGGKCQDCGKRHPLPCKPPHKYKRGDFAP
jgi:hypothetical protein